MIVAQWSALIDTTLRWCSLGHFTFQLHRCFILRQLRALLSQVLLAHIVRLTVDGSKGTPIVMSWDSM